MISFIAGSTAASANGNRLDVFLTGSFKTFYRIKNKQHILLKVVQFTLHTYQLGWLKCYVFCCVVFNGIRVLVSNCNTVYRSTVSAVEYKNAAYGNEAGA